jgi:hypothetical protein
LSPQFGDQHHRDEAQGANGNRRQQKRHQADRHGWRHHGIDLVGHAGECADDHRRQAGPLEIATDAGDHLRRDRRQTIEQRDCAACILRTPAIHRGAAGDGAGDRPRRCDPGSAPPAPHGDDRQQDIRHDEEQRGLGEAPQRRRRHQSHAANFPSAARS